jgi:hypothetical protein
MSVLFWKKVLKYQLNFKSFRVFSLFAYLGQLAVFSSLFVIFSLPEFPFLSSIHNFSSVPHQLVSKLKHILGMNFHQFSWPVVMGSWHGQVPNEKVSYDEHSTRRDD